MARYTAQQLREHAEWQEKLNGPNYIVADMLRQAADAMEREKMYEYTLRFMDGDRNEVADIHRDTEEGANNLKLGIYKEVVIRREVGEWEEVPNEG